MSDDTSSNPQKTHLDKARQHPQNKKQIKEHTQKKKENAQTKPKKKPIQTISPPPPPFESYHHLPFRHPPPIRSSCKRSFIPLGSNNSAANAPKAHEQRPRRLEPKTDLRSGDGDRRKTQTEKKQKSFLTLCCVFGGSYFYGVFLLFVGSGIESSTWLGSA